MKEELRKFLDECYEDAQFYDTMRNANHYSTLAYGAALFATQLNADEEIIELWRVYERKFRLWRWELEERNGGVAPDVKKRRDELRKKWELEK